MARTLHVTILGSGTCVPSLSRSACSVLVEAGSARILIDIGPGTMRRLLEAGLEIRQVSHLCLSHFHPDHSGELVPFLFASKYPEGHRRRTPLTLVGGAGLNRFMQGLHGVYGRWIELEEGMFSLEEVDGHRRDLRSFEDFSVETMPVDHNPESVAFRITDPSGRSVVYSGDTDVSENLVALSTGADLLICESAFPDDRKIPGHLTPSLAGELAAKAGVKRLVLTHLYPDCEGVDLEAACRSRFDGEVLVAEDLMQLSVG
ncbi:MAG: MBL fold metallo-hydrolase [Desulfobacterales bacterium]